MRSLTFVVGTGRCGSTALSRILNGHPDVVSLSEFFTAVRLLPPDSTVSGSEFWRILASPSLIFDAIIRSGVSVPEFDYLKLPGGRFNVDLGGIPVLCMTVLPHLSDDPDALFDELAADVPRWPRRTARDQYLALFNWLTARFGRTAVVERSGLSLGLIPWLRGCFPHGRLVHLHRNGPDCAVSMSQHAGFRMLVLVRQAIERHPDPAHLIGWLVSCLDHGADRWMPTRQYTSFEILALLREASKTPDWYSARKIALQQEGLIPPEIAPLLSDQFDTSQILSRPLPLTMFGDLWSELITQGISYLAETPPHLRTTLSYDDLLDDPHRCLTELAEFIGVEPLSDWLRTSSQSLDSTRRGAALRLPRPDLIALRNHCDPGARALSDSNPRVTR